MRGHGAKLPRKKEEALAALLTHSTFQAAADAVGIGVATLYRWANQADFMESYRAARRKVVQQAVAQVQAAMTEAVDSLCQVMGDTEASPSARVSAARTVLDFGLRGVELEDLETRIAKMENSLISIR